MVSVVCAVTMQLKFCWYHVLAYDWVHEGIESAEYFYPMGYVERARFPFYVALEYVGGAATTVDAR